MNNCIVITLIVRITWSSTHSTSLKHQGCHFYQWAVGLRLVTFAPKRNINLTFWIVISQTHSCQYDTHKMVFFFFCHFCTYRIRVFAYHALLCFSLMGKRSIGYTASKRYPKRIDISKVNPKWMCVWMVSE